MPSARPSHRRPRSRLFPAALSLALGLVAASSPSIATPTAADASPVHYVLVETWRSKAPDVAVTPLAWPAGHTAGGVGFGSDGTVLATDVTAGTVRVYGGPAEGHALRATIGGAGSAPGQLARPRDVAGLPGRRMAVSDSGNHRVQVLAADGAPLFAAPLLDPQGIDLLGDVLFAISRVDRQIVRLSVRADVVGSADLPTAQVPEGLDVFPYMVVDPGTGQPFTTEFGLVADPGVGELRTASATVASDPFALADIPGLRAAVYVGDVPGGGGPTLRFLAGAPEVGIVPVEWGPDWRGPLGGGSNIAFDGVTDLGISPAGDLYATVAPQGLVALGRIDALWPRLKDPFGRLVGPRRIAVGAGAALILDRLPRVHVWTPAGRPQRSVDMLALTSLAAQPVDVATMDGSTPGGAASAATHFVLDHTGRITAFDGLGRSLRSWEPPIDQPGRPIAISAFGDKLAVLDRARQEVIVRDADFSDVARYDVGGAAVRGVADVVLGSDRFALADPEAGQVELWRRDGVRIGAIDVPAGAERVAMGPTGDVFVLAGSGWVYVYDADGAPRGVWRAGGPTSRPADLAVDALGRVHVADSAGEIRVYAPGDPSAAQPLPAAGPGVCSALRDKTAAPPVIWLGETVDVTLEVDGTCPVEHAPADIALVIDQSESMRDDNKIAAAREAAAGFVARLDPRVARLSLIGFDSTARLIEPLSSDKPRLLDAVERLDYVPIGFGPGGTVNRGLTNLVDGLAMARQSLTGPDARAGVAKVIVMLSDGVHRPTEDSQPRPASLFAEIDRTHAAGIRVFAIALGSDADRVVMRRMASDAGTYFPSPSPADLRTIFIRIARSIGAQVLFETLRIVDRVPANMTYIPGFATPSEPVVSPDGKTLTWTFSGVAEPGVRIRYRLLPQEVGVWPTNIEAVADYVDGLANPGRLVFPIPRVTVLGPAVPSPTSSPTPSSTPTPSPSPTVPPTSTPTTEIIPTARPSITPARYVAYLPLLVREKCTVSQLNLVLVLDVSSSMDLPFGAGTKLDAARAAVRAFVDGIDLARDRVTLVAFHNTAWVAASGSDAGALGRALDDLRTATGTRIDLGLGVALDEVMARRRGLDERPVAVLLSDGAPNPGTEADAQVRARALVAAGATLYTVAVGADADRAFLRTAAGADERAFDAADGPALVALYRRLAGEIKPCVPSWGGGSDGRLPPLRPIRQQVEEVPHAAVHVARPEEVLRDALDAAVRELAERRDAGAIALAFHVVAHVLRERRAAGGDHGEGPAARGGEGALRFRGVGRGHDERGPLRDARQQAHEAVRPQRAVRAAAAHVVDDEQVVVCAEEVGEAHRRVVGQRQRVVRHVLRRQFLA